MSDYPSYLQSAHWLVRRGARLQLAGYQCEFCPVIEDGRGKHSFWLGERCESTGPLEVHHLHYGSLGHETDGDLEVLCRKHHLLRHLMEQECELCGDNLFYDEAEALDLVEHVFETVDPSPHAMSLDDVLDTRSWIQEAGNGRWCDHCDYVLSKDD